MKPENIYILRAVKLALRISHDKLDDDIESEIEACRSDLKQHGVIYANDSDPLILNAIKLWVRSAYAEDVVKGAAYLGRYQALRDNLKVSEGYGWKGDAE